MPKKKTTEAEDKPIVSRRKKEKNDEIIEVSKKEKEDVKENEIEVEIKPKRATRTAKRAELDKQKAEEEKTAKEAENGSEIEVKIEKEDKVEIPKENLKNEPIIRRSPKRTNLLDGIPGVKSEEIVYTEAHDLKQLKSSDEKEIATLEDLKTYMANKEILWGEVYGIDDGVYEMNGHVVFSVLYNGIRIQIPDQVFFEKSYDFGRDYHSLPDDGPEEMATKYKRRKERGQFYNGARVCFIIKAVSRETIEDGYFAGESEPKVYGSRVEAMEELRRIYFGKSSEMHVDVGSIAIANVLGVRPDKIRVECLGVETQIDVYNINEENAENCEEYFQTGDKLKVRIRKLHKNSDTDVYLTVSGRLNDINKMINSMHVGSSYLGTVDRFNRKDKTYKITLKNGVSASVKQSLVRGQDKLVAGDRVSVRVTQIRPGYVIGLAMKY